MMYRKLLVATALTSALCAFAALSSPAWGETVVNDNGIAVKDSDVSTPSRGMTMDQVVSKFGAPANKVPAVGNPPISRWQYPGFIVYFEHDHVIHAVVANS
jgi:hypothetical protein